MGKAVGIRLPDDLLEKVDRFSEATGDDRSTTVRKLLKLGYAEWVKDRAARAYMAGEATLSGAAEMAEVTLWEMERVLVEKGYRSRYDLEDLERELGALEG